VSKVYEIEGESYEERGYGPCSVCSKSIQWTDLWVGCPVSWCSDKSPGYWYHARCGSSTRMEISNRGKLRCKNCYATYQVGCWNFSCSEHGGTPESITPSSFRRALAVVLNWPDDCDEVIIDLSTYIADPKHRNEWFN
jgi:hypothetical protein